MTLNNPIDSGFYADPEARFYEGKYWIYATHSLPFKDQHNLSAFSSTDLVNWEKHENIIDMSGFPWAWGAVWAPTIIDKDGKYYLIFATNDIHSNEEPGGLEIAVSDRPQGPFKAMLDKPLIPDIINGAQPIDAHLFKDDDGKIYLYYGGWKHCNVCIMNDDMTGFVPFEDGEIYKEITPEEYVEGPCMIKKDGQYYFMWSTGGWRTSGYGVIYTKADSPVGPFVGGTKILQTDNVVAKGPGHHGFLQIEGTDDYLIVYHRRPMEETDGNSRVVCIDRMYFENGEIKPVVMTHSFEL